MKQQKSSSVHRVAPIAAAAILCGMTALMASASSHREAPSIAMNPSVDGTDLYMFRSYEAGGRPT